MKTKFQRRMSSQRAFTSYFLVMLFLLSQQLSSNDDGIGRCSCGLFVQTFSVNVYRLNHYRYQNCLKLSSERSNNRKKVHVYEFPSSRVIASNIDNRSELDYQHIFAGAIVNMKQGNGIDRSDNLQQKQPNAAKVHGFDRKTFMKDASFIATLLVSSTMIDSKYAFGDDNTIITESESIILQSDQIAISSALRNVKTSIKTLQSTEMELLVSSNDYYAVREKLRVIPISEIRKSCSTLMKYSVSSYFIRTTLPGYEETMTTEEKINRSELGISYQIFKKALEKMDSVASLGMSGRDNMNENWINSYQETITSLQSFLAIAERIFRT